MTERISTTSQYYQWGIRDGRAGECALIPGDLHFNKHACDEWYAGWLVGAAERKAGHIQGAPSIKLDMRELVEDASRWPLQGGEE